MSRRKLSLAPDKTEAILLTGRRKIRPVTFRVLGVDIVPVHHVKYLGVTLNRGLTLSKHIDNVAAKAEKTVTALNRIRPNVGGARASKRRFLCSVVHSGILYAAPIWERAIEVGRNRTKLTRIQRRTALRIASGYRTVSREAILVIAGVISIELLIIERKEILERGGDQQKRRETRRRTFERWQEEWSGRGKGSWTRRMIPNLQRWVERGHSEVNYHVTQAFSGHGCFQTSMG